MGPLFFVIFISDLPDFVCSGNTIALCADDCKTSRVIDNSHDHGTLFQEDLNNLWNWSKLNRMDFNIKKCKIMRISREVQPVKTELCMNESLLEMVLEFKDLGLFVDRHLSWNSHMNVSKAKRMLDLISRTCRDFAAVTTLNCSFVRSHLKYGSVVWSPYTQQNIDIIERVQRRATRLILKSDIDYASCLKKLNLHSLEQRRFMADVTFLNKALNGYLNVDLAKYLNF